MPTTTKPRRRRWARILRIALGGGLAAAGTVAAVLLLFEPVYRLQWIDTYRAEIESYNPPELLAERAGRPTLLAMGDSLTAGRHSYPALLRERLPAWRVINGGIPATSAFQAGLCADRRFSRFAPAVFVYQVNVTNDLLNQRFPIAWGRLSVPRNLYWTLVHRLRGVEYLNYRSAQLAFQLRATHAGLGDIVPSASCAHDTVPFVPGRYTLRERLYLRAEPALIENEVLLRGGRERDFAPWWAAVVALLERCVPPGCAAKLLVVPHAAQVAPGYLEDLRAAGARFDDAAAFGDARYPFLEAVRDGLRQRGLERVEVLDALPRLRAAEAAGTHTYFRYDPHLNACGQRVLAELVAESLAVDPRR